MTRKLYRSRTDRRIAGVCGGIADYLNIDSLLIRLIMLGLFIFQGSGLLLYILAWILIPDDRYVGVADERPDEEVYRTRNASLGTLIGWGMIIFSSMYIFGTIIPELAAFINRSLAFLFRAMPFARLTVPIIVFLFGYYLVSRGKNNQY